MVQKKRVKPVSIVTNQRKIGEWFCKLNSITALIEQGHSIDETISYEDFVCDDYEPP